MELPSGLVGPSFLQWTPSLGGLHFSRPLVAGPELAAVLGLGLGLGLLGPVAAALILLLHCKVCRLLPAATKSPGECLLSPAAPCPRAKAPLPSHHSLFPPPQGETASGPPSKRSMLTPTAPWPRSERGRWDGRVVGDPGADAAPCHLLALSPALHCCRCSWAGTLGSATYAVHTPTQGGPPINCVG